MAKVVGEVGARFFAYRLHFFVDRRYSIPFFVFGMLSLIIDDFKEVFLEIILVKNVTIAS